MCACVRRPHDHIIQFLSSKRDFIQRARPACHSLRYRAVVGLSVAAAESSAAGCSHTAYKSSSQSHGVGSVPDVLVYGDGPDLLMRFTPGGASSAALTTDGFPPWYLRLTEIQ